MFFLKYRPQVVDDLDLKLVREQLKKILQRKDFPQALLFAGPKGSGKTSAARILAKAINCPKSKNHEPCNKCSLCREITDGISLDVLEIDAASNRGIDDIRQLKEKIGLAPIKAKKKIYIIDEVHMLTKEAFNALLKTLEEPPANVVFILCTTDPGKIIPTVLSRLIRIDFTKGNKEEVLRSLQKVIKGEKLKVDKKVIDLIIQLADGSFRDAQKILESLVLSLDKKITWGKAKNLLGYWQQQRPETVLELIGENKLKKALQTGEELAKQGADFSDYLGRLLNLIQRLILIKVGLEKDQDLKKLKKLFSLEKLVSLSRAFSKALVEQKSATLSQLPFQLAIAEAIQRQEPELVKNEEDSNNNQLAGDEAEELEEAEEKEADNEMKPGPVALEDIKASWDQILTVIKPLNHSVAAFLRAARPKEVNGNTVILEVFYQFHKDKLEEDRNRRIVEEGLEKICSSRLKIKCVLGENETKKAAPVRSEPKEKSKDELYQIAKEIFGG